MLGINKEIFYIQPSGGATFGEQLINCLLQLNDKLVSISLGTNNVVMQTVFMKIDKEYEYLLIKEGLYSVILNFYGQFCPPVSFIAQEPCDECLITLQVLVLTDNSKIIQKQCNGFNYTVVQQEGSSEVYAAGLTTSFPDDECVLPASKYAFDIMKSILCEEGLTFSDVVRQWNYIEKIYIVNRKEGMNRQNYQIFNDVRSFYYSKIDFKHGYPAATGIGIKAGGVIIDFIAMVPAKNIKVYSLKNPEQFDAYQYTESVLVGAPIREFGNRTTPKFERAKLILKPQKEGLALISGTAAIIGQDVPEKNIEEQTRITLDNIIRLVSTENIKQITGKSFRKRKMSSLRVYVKEKDDISVVKLVCEEYFKEIDIQYLIADICREDLLVEIEGSMILG